MMPWIFVIMFTPGVAHIFVTYDVLYFGRCKLAIQNNIPPTSWALDSSLNTERARFPEMLVPTCQTDRKYNTAEWHESVKVSK